MLREVVLALTLAAPPSVALHVQVGGGAGVPAVDRGAVWVPNTHDGTISRVGSGGAVVTTIKLGAGTTSNGFLDSAVVAGGKVWVARNGAAGDRPDRPCSDRVTKRVRVALRPGGLTAGGGYVWAFHFLGPQVTRIDQTTGVKKVFTVAGLAGSGIVYAGGAVWVVSSGSTALLRLDPANGAVLARVGLPLPATPKHGIIDAWWVAAGAGSLWVAETNYDRVVRVTGKVARAIPVPVVAPFEWSSTAARPGWGARARSRESIRRRIAPRDLLRSSPVRRRSSRSSRPDRRASERLITSRAFFTD